MDLPNACQVKMKILWIYLMVAHLMNIRSYACLLDGCLLTSQRYRSGITNDTNK